MFPKQEWTDASLAAVLASPLATVTPKDAKAFCPNGMTPHNWVHLMAAMARYESNFNTDEVYLESFKGSDGKRIISIGLFQISLSSGNAYGCKFKDQAALKDPIQNLKCAVLILSRWIPKDGVIALGSNNATAKGGARYWSVLRTSGKLSSVKNTLKLHCE